MALPIDRGWAWVITLACGGLFFWIAGNEKNRGIILVEVMEIYPEKSATSVLWIFSLGKLVNRLSAPFNSWLLAKTSARFMGMLGVSIMTVGMLIFAYVPMEYMYLAWGVIFGIGNGMILLIVYTASAPYFDKRKGLSLGLTAAGSGIGMLVTALLLRKLFDNYSFSGAMTLYTGLCLQTMVLAALLRPLSYYSRWEKTNSVTDDDLSVEEDNTNNNSRNQEKFRGRSQSLGMGDQQGIAMDDPRNMFLSAPDKIDSLSSHQASRKKENYQLSSLQILASSLQDLDGPGLTSAAMASDAPSQEGKVKKKSFDWRLAYNPWCLVLGFSVLIYSSGVSVILQCIPPLGKEIGLSKEFVSILLSVCGIMEIPMRIFNGWLADRKVIPVAAHVGLCMTFTGLMALLCGLLNNTAGIVAAMIGMGATGTSVFNLMPVTYREVFGIDAIESGMAINFVYMGISNIVSTFATGGIYEATQHWRNVYYYIAACTISGGIIMFLVAFAIRRKANRRAAELTNNAD